jgi:hypothetical protein
VSLNLVFSDLVKLADGLRSKGLTKQADELEDKIYQLKQAETHLYKAFEEDGQDLLDFAHPDGSPTVSPAQNQMGQVETLDEAQRKVLEIINKKPTGKFSSEIRDLILITAEALDLSLIKSGQEKTINLPEVKITNEDPNPNLEGLEGLGDIETSEKDISNENTTSFDDQLKDISPENQEKIFKAKNINNTINKYLSAIKDKINDVLKSAGVNEDSRPSWFSFNADKVWNGEQTEAYVKRLGNESITSNEIINFNKSWISLFGNVEPTEETLQGIISSLVLSGDYKALKNKFSDLDPKSASTYFYGAQFVNYNKQSSNEEERKKALENGDFRYNINSNSVYIITFGGGTFDKALNVGVKSLIPLPVHVDYFGKKLVNQIPSIINSPAQVTFSENKIQEASSVIWKNIVTKKNDLVSQQNIDIASNNVWSEIKTGLIDLKTASDQFSITPVRNSSSLAIGDVQNISSYLENNSPQINKTLFGLKDLGLESVTSKAASSLGLAAKQVNILLNYLIDNQLDPVLDVPAASNSVNIVNVANTFAKIAKIYNNYLKENPELSDRKRQIISNNINLAIQVYKVISSEKDNVDKPYGYILRNIPEQLQNLVKSPQALQALSQKTLKEALEFTLDKEIKKINKIQNKNLIKHSDDNDNADAAKRKKQLEDAAAQGGFANPNEEANKNVKNIAPRQTSVTKSYDPKDSVQTAVAEMQLVLNNFGRLISKTNPTDGFQIIGTGPKNEVTSRSFDGIWGPNTANSLEKANKYVGGRLNESVKWIAANKNHVAGTEQIAKNNTAILNSAIIGMWPQSPGVAGVAWSQSHQGGQSSVTQTGEILDEISKNINWSDPTSGDPAGPGWGDSAKEFLGVKKSGTIPIYKNNLYSFSSLYRFVTANNLKQIETASVDKSIGFSYKTWHEILNWFVNRAKYNFSQAGQDENKLKLAQTYYYASKRLLDIINKFPQNEEFIAPTSKLDSLLGGNSNIEKYKKNKQNQEGGFQGFTSGDMEGTRVQVEEGQSESDSSPYQTLPYDNNTINFNHSLWEQTGIRDKFGLPLLKLRISDLKGAPSQVANNLFGGSVLSPQAREEAEAKRLGLKGIWREDVGLVGANGDQIFNDNKKNKLMFKYSPDNTYRLFLSELRKALYDVTRDFAENAAKESSDQLSEPYKTWNNTISNQENRITNQR